MTTRKAIKTLYRHAAEINDLPSSPAWIVQTQTYMASFFGPDSPQVKEVQEWEPPEGYGWMHEDFFRRNREKDRDAKQAFLASCIQALQDVGVYQPVKPNLFTGLSNGQIVAGAIGVGLFLFSAAFTWGYAWRRAELPFPFLHD